MSDNLNHEQLSSEYNLLMNVLEVSVSKHLRTNISHVFGQMTIIIR